MGEDLFNTKYKDKLETSYKVFLFPFSLETKGILHLKDWGGISHNELMTESIGLLKRIRILGNSASRISHVMQ